MSLCCFDTAPKLRSWALTCGWCRVGARGDSLALSQTSLTRSKTWDNSAVYPVTFLLTVLSWEVTRLEMEGLGLSSGGTMP